MLQIRINGTLHTFDGDPATPLLWALREEFGLTGPKHGCGAALCGCCTVHVDGDARRACVTPIGAIGTSSVITIEGLPPAGATLHPVQAAWIELDVAQCGYCQTGQIMQAAALLSKTPEPSDRDIDDAMSGNLCRCGTYNQVRQAIKLAARELAAARK